MEKYLFQCFEIFSIFISNESLPMKSHQLFKIYKRFDKEREKNTHTVANGERKTEKSWTLFYNRLFYKAIQNGNHFSSICFFVHVSFYFASSILAQLSLFVIRVTQEISKLEIGNSKLLGMANCRIYFKDIFNVLVTNVTQIDFIDWQKCTLD